MAPLPSWEAPANRGRRVPPQVAPSNCGRHIPPRVAPANPGPLVPPRAAPANPGPLVPPRATPTNPGPLVPPPREALENSIARVPPSPYSFNQKSVSIIDNVAGSTSSSGMLKIGSTQPGRGVKPSGLMYNGKQAITSDKL
ncbi:vegetative cell wall protein gp1-like [Impatiens glandulifera]|uniref:vegetative cell wall protein gp1-like n=1 Tax=Impatiens glandulifera TaxID=253017 RepID=UPI001FB04F6B|nr:vegetative cell wall protein gp1-like [Impatiens glandulifera]